MWLATVLLVSVLALAGLMFRFIWEAHQSDKAQGAALDEAFAQESKRLAEMAKRLAEMAKKGGAE
jgi:hypothetical protein